VDNKEKQLFISRTKEPCFKETQGKAAGVLARVRRDAQNAGHERKDQEGGKAMVSISQVRTSTDVEHAQGLMREYTAWAFALSAETIEAPTFEGLEQELESLPGPYAPPAGRLLLAKDNGQPAGCVALKSHSATEGELKRLYVRPDFRGQKIGRKLVLAVIEEARGMGLHNLVLDSHRAMKSAHRIYEAAGFRRVEAPRDFPETIKPIAVFMELRLTEAG
jgi:putative acetyltransferase